MTRAVGPFLACPIVVAFQKGCTEGIVRLAKALHERHQVQGIQRFAQGRIVDYIPQHFVHAPRLRNAAAVYKALPLLVEPKTQHRGRFTLLF